MKGKFAVRDDRLAAALHDADQHLRSADRRQIFQLHAVKLPALTHAVLHDLNAALGEGIDSGGTGEAQYARDLLGALVFGVYGYRQAKHLAQEFRLPQVFGVSYTRDDVLRAELARGDAADHVDLVLLGRGHEEIGLRRARAEQRLMVRRAALHAYDVKLVGEVGYGFGVAVDDRDIVPLLGEYFCNRVADLAGSYNNYFHSLLLSIKSTQKPFILYHFPALRQGQFAFLPVWSAILAVRERFSV